MILASIKDAARIAPLHPAFQMVFDYVATHDLLHAPAGRITLDGEKVFINVDDALLRKQEEQSLEIHRRYIDIHFPLSGNERVGWTPLNELHVESQAPFDTERDLALFPQQAKTYFTATPGDFYIMFPEDAHAPIIGSGSLRKIIAKVIL